MRLAPVIVILALVGILYGAWVSTGAARHEEAHRLFVGEPPWIRHGAQLFTFTAQGLSGGILQMANHGLSTGALFLLVGMIYERRHSRLIADFGGLWAVVPVFSAILMLVTFSSIGLPGLNGFVGEFLILVVPVEPPGRGARYGGIVFAAVYLLWMYQRVVFGEVRHDANRRLPDLNAGDLDAGPDPGADRLDRGLPEAVHGRDGDRGDQAPPGRARQAGGRAGGVARVGEAAPR